MNDHNEVTFSLTHEALEPVATTGYFILCGVAFFLVQGA